MEGITIIKPPTPIHSSDSDPDNDPSKKRKNNPSQLHDSPPRKRPQKDKQPAKELHESIKDTATSPLKKKGQHDDDDVEGVTISDLSVLKSIITFQNETGVYPFESSSAMKQFCHRWSRLGLASSRQMKAKIEGVKYKFDDGANAEEVVKFYGYEKEFELWKKISWEKEPSGDDGDGDKDKDEGGCS